MTRHTKIGRALAKRWCQPVFIKLPKVAVSLRAATGGLCRKRGTKPELVRIGEQDKRLFGKAVGVVGTAVMKQAPHSFQKPGRCPRRQANDPEAIARRSLTVTACVTVVIYLRLRVLWQRFGRVQFRPDCAMGRGEVAACQRQQGLYGQAPDRPESQALPPCPSMAGKDNATD